MLFSIVTIFPEMFQAITNYGITKRTLDNKIAKLQLYNPRDYSTNKHFTVDDRPYGGGPGMVMKVEPMLAAINAAKQDLQNINLNSKPLVICLSPQGTKITQKHLRQCIKKQDSIIFVCGRYEGIDERIHQLAIDEEWSIGDFILTGGELAAMAFVDALIRLIPGALGDPGSFEQDSFGEDLLLDHPHYTRPQCIYGLNVPEVLLSGNHGDILNWRQQQRLIRTTNKRKDLLNLLNEEQHHHVT